MTVGEVLNGGDAFDLFRLDGSLDPLDDFFGTNLVGQFGDNNALLAGCDVLRSLLWRVS